MNNIFKNAYFGKPYKTRDGRKAHYCGKQVLMNICELDGELIDFFSDGTYCNSGETSFDIVSEHQEELNEEELNKLATIEGAKAISHFINREQSKFAYEWADLVKEAYKAGYCKAKEIFK